MTGVTSRPALDRCSRKHSSNAQCIIGGYSTAYAVIISGYLAASCAVIINIYSDTSCAVIINIY